MNQNRTSGLALGFGIGIVIAGAIFGISWVTKNFSGSIKTQAIQSEEPVATASPATIEQPINTQPEQDINSQDNLVNRLAPAKEDVVEDIQNNLQELYGTKTTP